MKSSHSRRRARRRFVVSVTDFGAKGDGLTDDSAAFKSAKRCRALKIKVPAGVYVITENIHLDDRFTGVVNE